MFCQVDGCKNLARSSKRLSSSIDLLLCGKHEQRWRKGRALDSTDRQIAKGRVCCVDECFQPVRCKGFCAKHYRASSRVLKGYSAAKWKQTGLKTCPACKVERPISEWPVRINHGKLRLRSYCYKCEASKAREYRSRLTSEEKKARAQIAWEKQQEERKSDPEWALRRSILASCTRLKLSFDEVWSHWLKTEGACDICGSFSAPGSKRPHIDHDHSTGRFRGILCSRHNTMIGQASDDPVILQAAIDYLSKKV